MTWFQIIWTATPCPGRKLLERQSLGWFLLLISLLKMCLARNRRWIGEEGETTCSYLRDVNGWQHFRSITLYTSSWILIIDQVRCCSDVIQSLDLNLHKVHLTQISQLHKAGNRSSVIKGRSLSLLYRWGNETQEELLLCPADHKTWKYEGGNWIWSSQVTLWNFKHKPLLFLIP